MQNNNGCYYLDKELDCCKKLSDWRDAMPRLIPCSEDVCPMKATTTKANDCIVIERGNNAKI